MGDVIKKVYEGAGDLINSGAEFVAPKQTAMGPPSLTGAGQNQPGFENVPGTVSGPPKPSGIDRWLPLMGAAGAALSTPSAGGAGPILGNALGTYANTRMQQAERQQQAMAPYQQALFSRQLAGQAATAERTRADTAAEALAAQYDATNPELAQRIRVSRGLTTAGVKSTTGVLPPMPRPLDDTTKALREAQTDLANKRVSDVGGGPAGGKPRIVTNPDGGIQFVYPPSAANPRGRVVPGPRPEGTPDPSITPIPLDPTTGRAEDVLKTVTPGDAQIVRNLVDYKMPLPAGFALRSAYWQRILGLASQYDPTFDAAQYTVRMNVRKDFTSGKSSQAVNALNTVVGHLATLKERAGELNNTSAPRINWLTNYLKTEAGSPDVKNFNVAKGAVAREMTRVFRGTGGTAADIKDWEDNVSASGSPEQLQGAIDQALELLDSRIDALQSQYEKGIGRPMDFDLLNPKSQEILTRLRGGAATSSSPPPQTTPTPVGDALINKYRSTVTAP